MKIAYITDSGTGYNAEELNKYGIFSLPLQIEVDNKNYFDLEDITISDVIEYLKENRKMSTSLPSLGRIDSLFKELKEKGYTKVIACPICSGLSGTINALSLMAEQYKMEYEYIDCYVTAEVEKYITMYLKETIGENNQNHDEAFAKVKEIVSSANTILIPDNLKHLSKSGRLTPLAAGIGDFFNIKPILWLNERTGGKIDVIDKVRTYKKALSHVLKIMKEEINDKNYIIYLAHVDCLDTAIEFKEILNEEFPNNNIKIIELCSPVSIHTGRGCLAIQYFKKVS